MYTRILFYCILVLSLLTNLVSCRSTLIKGFTDPDYHAFKIHKLLVDAPNALFDDAFTNKTKNIDVVYAATDTIFLPTRSYTSEEKASIIKQNGFDAYLYIDITSNDKSSRVVAYQTKSTANAYSTGYGSAYASGTSTTLPVTSHKRRTTAKATLYEVKTGRVVWVADLDTKDSGSLYMSNRVLFIVWLKKYYLS